MVARILGCLFSVVIDVPCFDCFWVFVRCFLEVEPEL